MENRWNKPPRSDIFRVVFPRAVIGLFLALVFQLAQIAPCLAAACTPVVQAGDCGCCEKHDTCPCASNKTGHDRSTPVAPPASGVKVQLALPSFEPMAPQAAAAGTAAPRGSPAALRNRTAGHAGVPLAVSFCSFVI